MLVSNWHTFRTEAAIILNLPRHQGNTLQRHNKPPHNHAPRWIEMCMVLLPNPGETPAGHSATRHRTKDLLQRKTTTDNSTKGKPVTTARSRRHATRFAQEDRVHVHLHKQSAFPKSIHGHAQCSKHSTGAGGREAGELQQGSCPKIVANSTSTLFRTRAVFWGPTASIE